MASLPPLECIHLTQTSLTALNNGTPNFNFPHPLPVLRFLFELCSTLVRGDLPIEKCRAALEAAEFCESVSEDEVGSYLADIVTQMAQDLTMTGDYRVRLIKMAKWFVESSLVPLRFFQERCEEEFLWEAELIKIKAADLKSKEVRVNTRLLYQQTKFNLLREESEGYAKLVTLLCQVPKDSVGNASAATVGIIKSLIGHFDLDPNRVFDIVLECFELQPDNNVFLDFIPMFPKSHASQILGFKFQYYQRLEVNSPVPIGLYQLTALLVKKDLIDIDCIYAHLLPKDEEAFEHYGTYSAKRLDEANKIGKINLAATGKDLMDDEKPGDVTVDLHSAFDMEAAAVTDRSSELESNQTLGLLMGFLAVDDWYHAHMLLKRLSSLNPVEHVEICNGLFRLIEKSISSALDVIHRTRDTSFLIGTAPETLEATNTPVKKPFIDLPKELFEMLASTGPYLFRDTLLLQKICRVLRAHYLCALESVGSSKGALNPKNARLRIVEALGACILPSLQLIPANPAIGQEIWELMSLFPYEVRYGLYGEWEKDDEQFPMILSARQTAKLDTRRILKRLAKENLKQLGRMVAKLAHANPLTVLRTIVHQIEAYRDMITPVVDAFKYLTQLEYDILEYVVVERLAQGGRDKLKDDGLNLSDWLQSLASFWGHLCKKYPSMELRGLFQYLVNQLKKGIGIELVLLQELMQQMANVQYTENMTEEQLDAMAGSDTLRYHATSYGLIRNNKTLAKSMNRLRDALLPKEDPKLAIPLLLLIAQHRSLVVINADVPHIKMVSEQFDRCHGTLLQYVDFLGSAVVPSSSYSMMVPTLDELTHDYHLDPEVAFLIYRPAMRLFKCRNNSDVLWPSYGKESTDCLTVHKDSAETALSASLVLDLGPSRKPITWSDLLDTVKTMLPPKAWNSLSPDLYATFWGLTLYDLYVPRSRYESEIAKQHAAIRALEEYSDNSSSAIMKRKKDKERIQESLDRLSMELEKHEDHVASVRRRLAREKDTWLSSCLITLKINMEFLQRCIFPRCTFSMSDAVYCAMFVNTLHALGTPFFNTVNHLDVLICKTIQPMICCCTEYEVGRLGRFLFETLKTAYYWKSKESIYERECGNMPGFAVYYRYPNSQRVTYGQFIKVHWKWSQRITRLLIQCLESAEYMEIRNALILLTKISSVFPVTRKSGINIEKRVAKIRSEEREDLKVLATGVAAALAARKPAWVTDEEFGMGYLEIKPVAVPVSKSSVAQNGAGSFVPHGSNTTSIDGTTSARDSRTRTGDARVDRIESSSLNMDPGSTKGKGGLLPNGSEVQAVLPPSTAQPGTTRSVEHQTRIYESTSRQTEDIISRDAAKTSAETEGRGVKRSAPSGSVPKQDLVKDDGKHTKSLGNGSTSALAKGSTSLGRPLDSGTEIKSETVISKASDSRTSTGKGDSAENFDGQKQSSSRLVHSPRRDNQAPSTKSIEKLQKRTSSADDVDKSNKRRKGEADLRDLEGVEGRYSERERSVNLMELDKPGSDDHISNRVTDKLVDKVAKKGSERHDRDSKDRLERIDKSRGDDFLSEKLRERSVERHGRERSVDRLQDRGPGRDIDRLNRDERNKLRHGEPSTEKALLDERSHGQGLPPPPPLPPHVVPQSLSAGRRDDDADRRFGSSRHAARLSPRHEERERRRSEENSLVIQEDVKRRRDDDFHDRKREDRDSHLIKVDDRDSEREREKVHLLKDDVESTAASKRRKLKREHLSMEPGEYSPAAVTPALSINLSQTYDGRERDRKVSTVQRSGYVEEPGLRIHGKDATGKTTRRDSDPYPEWDDDKRQRAEQKRRHRK